MKILVLNSGSSTIKFQLFDMANAKPIAIGLIEKIGEKDSFAKLLSTKTNEKWEKNIFIKNHHDGFEIMKELFQISKTLKSFTELDGVGHRIVHGGEVFHQPTLIDKNVIEILEEISPLAPLHNPGHIAGIKNAMEETGNIPHIAIFDTVFHQTMPDYTYLYAIPYHYYTDLHIRRYGFHGTSHEFVSRATAKFLNIPFYKFNAISLHLGNGASATAIQNGKSIDTSMGLSPLEGLIMGTRCGDIDPTVLFHLGRVKGYSKAELDEIVHKESGLKGICGTNDMREIQERIQNNDKKAAVAFNMFIYRLKKYIGAYYAILGRVDALIYTGGIGENSSLVREASCNGLTHLGLKINKKENSKPIKETTCVSSDDSTIKIMVTPTNEELEIANQTAAMIKTLNTK